MTNPATHETWLELATSRPVVLRALGCSAVVGAILAAINHGDCIMHGKFGGKCFLQSSLTAIVPFVVSTVSSVQALRQQSETK